MRSENLVKTSTTALLPSDAGNAGSMVAQALTVFDTVRNRRDSVHGGTSIVPRSPPTTS